MDGNHEDDCRYCEQDRNGGWIYCRSCGRLLSQARVVAATRTNGTAKAGSTASANAGGASGA